MDKEITPDSIIYPEKWRNMIFPCCKKNIPASLDDVALVTCSCGKIYLPATIVEYNKLRERSDDDDRTNYKNY